MFLSLPPSLNEADSIELRRRGLALADRKKFWRSIEDDKQQFFLCVFGGDMTEG
jgi:hypothetical protein